MSVGSAFTLPLELTPVDDTVRPPDRADEDAPALPDGLRVLVVDDDPGEVRRTLTHWLRLYEETPGRPRG